jgi:hypothetical protein
MAISRRFAEKFDATTVSVPRPLSAAMMAMPMGPQPITNAVSPRVMADLFTACRPSRYTMRPTRSTDPRISRSPRSA